jgi:hypothetical protein
MEWIGGTKKAKNLINALQNDGFLINLYSKEVLEKPSIQEIFDQDKLDGLIEQHGNKYLNHMLVGCFHSSNLDTLINLFAPCKEYFDNCYKHKYYDTRPCFAVINLKTKTVCIMSIGNRKGHYYEDYFVAFNNNLDITKSKFEEYDFLGIVKIIRESLETITNVMNKNCFYEESLTDEDWDEYKFQEEYLQKIFPNFELSWIEETFQPF